MLIPKVHQLSTFEAAVALGLVVLTAWLILGRRAPKRRATKGTKIIAEARSLAQPDAAAPPAKMKHTRAPKALPLRPTPMDPVSPFDDRPAVCDLLAEHGENLAKLHAEVSGSAFFLPGLHDSLWLLRFLLSHPAKQGSVSEATRAALATMEYRSAKGLDDPDVDITAVFPNERDGIEKLYRSGVERDAYLTCHPDPDREPILYLRLAGMDQHRMVKAMTPEENMDGFMFMSEWNYKVCDAVTRRTGRLTKSVRCVDMAGFRFSMLNKEKRRRDAAMSQAFEDYYPQLLAQVFILNPPGFVQGLWRVSKPFFPKRFTDKVGFASPATSPSDVRLLMRFVRLEDLPARFGGTCTIWPPPPRGSRGAAGGAAAGREQGKSTQSRELG